MDPARQNVGPVGRRKFNFPRWLLVAGSMTLMAVVALIAAAQMKNLRNAMQWRRHTVQVILAAQSFEGNLLDIRRGVRGYVTAGDTNALASFQSSVALEPRQFNQLVALTADNPAQQRRLKILAAAVDTVLTYYNHVIATYNSQGFAGVSKLDVADEGGIIFGRARDALDAFLKKEQELLDARDASEQAEYHTTGCLLVFGSVLAVALLLLADFMAAREMNQHRLAEAAKEKLIAELQQTLAHVKTLSGLIPICAWCKSVRSDTGYWQSVEQYVRTHSEARFSHGVCPSCAEKFKDEIHRLNQSAEVVPPKT
jgi:CHASE3 domain sensor protein